MHRGIRKCRRQYSSTCSDGSRTSGWLTSAAIITPQNAVYETERLIAEAFYHRRPVYMAIPTDVADQEVLESAQPLDPPRSNPDSIKAATEARYSELPHALGCDGWFTARVTTCGELDQALQQASQKGSASYIEVVTDEYAAPPLPQKLHENRDTLYAT